MKHSQDCSCGECFADKLKEQVKFKIIETVDHPLHYVAGGIEVIDFIEAKKLNYRLGNVVKYVARADHKGRKLEDLKKARWYLDREIHLLEKENAV